MPCGPAASRVGPTATTHARLFVALETLTIRASTADKGDMLLRIAKTVTAVAFAAGLAALFGFRH